MAAKRFSDELRAHGESSVMHAPYGGHYSDASEIIAKVRELEDESENLRVANRKIIDERDEARVDAGNLECQSVLLREDSAKLREKVRELEDEIAQLEKSRDEWKGRAECLDRQGAKVAGERDDVRKEAELLRQGNAGLLSANQDLREERDAAREELKHVRETLLRRNDRYDVVVEDCAAARANAEENFGKAQQMSVALRAAEQQRGAARMEIIRLIAERDRQSRELSSARSDWERALSERDTAREELEKLRIQIGVPEIKPGHYVYNLDVIVYENFADHEPSRKWIDVMRTDHGSPVLFNEIMRITIPVPLPDRRKEPERRK